MAFPGFLCRGSDSFSDSGLESDTELAHSFDILPDMDFGMYGDFVILSKYRKCNIFYFTHTLVLHAYLPCQLPFVSKWMFIRMYVLYNYIFSNYLSGICTGIQKGT